MTPLTTNNILTRGSGATNLTGFDKIYSVSYVWYGAIGVFTSVLFGVLISLMTLRYSEKPDETTIVKIDFRKLFRIKKQVKAVEEETNVDKPVNE
jgi:hypothetical protein